MRSFFSYSSSFLLLLLWTTARELLKGNKYFIETKKLMLTTKVSLYAEQEMSLFYHLKFMGIPPLSFNRSLFLGIFRRQITIAFEKALRR